MRTIIAVVLTAELLAAGTVVAQKQATLVPALSVSTLHDENVFSSPSAVGDVVTTFRPSLEGLFESPTVNVQSLVSFDMQASAAHSALNSFDARRQALFDGRFRTTPSALLGFAARYDRTETPGDLNLDTGILLERQLAERLQLTPSFSYRVTPYTTITTQYDWTTEVLSSVIGGDLHSARIGISRRLSPLTTWNARYIGRLFIDHTDALFIPAGTEAIGDTHRSHAAVFGWSRELSPATTLSFEGGPRFTSRGNLEPEVLSSLVRRTPRTRFLIDYWRGETIVLGIRGPVEIHSGSTKMNWALRRNLDLGTAFAVFRSATLEDREAMVYHASIVGAWSREPYILAMSYGADLQRGNIRTTRPADEQVHRGVFSVRLTIAPRLSRAFRPGDGDRPTTPIKGVIQ